MKFSSNVFIVGYSLSDYHISALLLENPALAAKTIFIQPPGYDNVFVRRTANYGSTFFIGVDGFADFLRNIPRSKPIADLKRLKSFRILEPLRDKKGLQPPTAIEVQNFLVFGTFNYSRCASTLPNATYVIPRQKEVSDITLAIERNRSIIVDSRLGNGKTVFLYLTFLSLAELGYTCLLFKASAAPSEQEFQALSSIEKLAILFDEFASSQDAIRKIGDTLPKAKLIVEIRTSIFEVRYHDVNRDIPKPYARISLNALSQQDVYSFFSLCAGAGIPIGSSYNKRPNTELRELLLDILESHNIKSKIDKDIKPVFGNLPKRRVLLITMLLSKFHLSTDAAFIRSVTGVDPYHEFRPIKEISDELFETQADSFRIRSAVFSDFAVRHLLEPGEMGDCIVETALAAAARKNDRVYRVLMSNLMQYSNLLDLFSKVVDANGVIIGLYERLRYDQRINDEPLFWLQYAIAVSEAKQLLPAEQFIKTAYERAAAQSGFRTYQIDTQAFRILLLIEEETAAGAPVARIQQILEKFELLTSMLGEESHRTFAIRVLDEVMPFLQKRRDDLTSAEKGAVVFWIAKTVDALAALPKEYRAAVGSDLTRNRLVAAKQLLL